MAYNTMARPLSSRLFSYQVDFASSPTEISLTEQRGPMSLCNLPNEVMLIILGDLELEDQFRLSTTCRHFQFIVRSDGICRFTLRVSFWPTDTNKTTITLV